MFYNRTHPYELISKAGGGYGLDVIVVAPAYRLNVFGFLGAETTGEGEGDGELSGNWGFWDQRCAIEWVSENIKDFGGDKRSITLGGMSAGIFPLPPPPVYEC